LNPFNPPPGGFEGPQPGSSAPAGFIPPAAGSMNTMAFVDYYNPTTGETWSAPNGGWTAPEGWEIGSPPGGLKNTLDGTVTPEPVFTPPPPPPEPNGFFPGINPEDFEDFDFGNMDFSNLGNMDFSNLPKPPSNLPNTSPPVPPVAAQAPYVAPVEPEPIYTPPPRFEMEDIMQNMPTPTGTLGGPMEYSDARSRSIMTGSPMPNIEDYDMSSLGPKGPMPPTTTSTTGPLTGTFGNFGPFTPPPMSPYGGTYGMGGPTGSGMDDGLPYESEPMPTPGSEISQTPIYTPPPKRIEDIIQNMPTPTAPALGGRFNPDIQQVANGGGYTPTAPAKDTVSRVYDKEPLPPMQQLRPQPQPNQ
jgi:hypothetical protein